MTDQLSIEHHPHLPDALPLGHEGRLFLLSWLHANVTCGIPLDADSWREAWGRAADYQTVCDGRKVLASEVTS